MIFRMLTEDIAAVRKLYPKISKNDFDRLIALDPTYDRNRDSVGTYGKWILNLFNKGKLDNEGHVTDVLIRFNTEKNQLKNKDINTFKSLDELDAYLNDESNYKELSARQKLRRTQTEVRKTEVGKEADLIFSNDNWEVWIPRTHTASCKLGQGSRWCTASTGSDYYFNNYNNKGPLFININKLTEHKWQFHSQTNSYMDENDVAINLANFFEQNMDLANFYYEYGKETGNIYKNARAIKRRADALEKYSGDLNIFDYTKETAEDFRYVKDLVTEVVMDKTVTSIPKEQFENCHRLTRIVLGPKVRKIGDRAFAHCTNIRQLSLPDSITDIGEYAFCGCISLQEMVIPQNVSYLAGYAFVHCGSLKRIEFKNSAFGMIPQGFLMGCNKLEEVIIPEGFVKIGPGALNGTDSLRHIIFPESMKTILNTAFRGSGIEELDCKNIDRIDMNAFEGCIILRSVKCDNIVRIGARAFAKTPNLTTFNIPSTAFEVKSKAFAESGIREINVDLDKAGENWDKDWSAGCKAKINWKR